MITQLEQRFENLKEQFSNEEIVLIFAKFESEKLLQEVTLAIKLLENVQNEDLVKQRVFALFNQVKEFDEFLEDLIEKKHKKFSNTPFSPPSVYPVINILHWYDTFFFPQLMNQY